MSTVTELLLMFWTAVSFFAALVVTMFLRPKGLKDVLLHWLVIMVIIFLAGFSLWFTVQASQYGGFANTTNQRVLIVRCK